MGFHTMELDGRPLKVLDGSLSEVAQCVHGRTMDVLAHVHEGLGKSIYDGRSPYHPFLRPAMLAGIRLLEAWQGELVQWDDENGGLVDIPETMPSGCRACTLVQIFHRAEEEEVLFQTSAIYVDVWTSVRRRGLARRRGGARLSCPGR